MKSVITMRIFLNGSQTDTTCSTVFMLRDRLFSPDCITILNGFQTSDDLPLNNGDSVCIIKKDTLPPPDQLEAMMSARHTPGVYEKMKMASVAVCGLGGLGSQTAVMLARSGVGHLKLIDFDTVEPSNLNRQNYFIKHLGMYKADALCEEIKEINPYIKTEGIVQKITENNAADLLRGYNIICEAFDDPSAKAMLVQTVLENMPDCNIICGSGMAGFESSCSITTRRPMRRLYICGDGESEAGPGNGLMAPRVAVCAGHQANMVMRLILGIEEP